MTFSLRPSSTSALPDTAASVRTRVVSCEGRSRDEGPGLQRRLGDAEQDRHGRSGLLAVGFELGVESRRNRALSSCSSLSRPLSPGSVISTFCSICLTMTSMCLSLINNALEAIDLLDLVDQILGQFLDALDGKDVVRSRVAVHDELAAAR